MVDNNSRMLVFGIPVSPLPRYWVASSSYAFDISVIGYKIDFVEG